MFRDDPMTAAKHGMSDLEQLLDYELRCAKRYRRFVSIIVVAPVNGFMGLKGIFEDDAIRECDQFFEVDDGSAILMTETDSAGAVAALERCQVAADDNRDLRFAVVSFPFDGHTAAELLETAHRRLDRAKNMPGRGAAITTG